ncbi:MAG: hypothetical protein ACOCWL_02665 [Thermoguttaceae bacterium]
MTSATDLIAAGEAGDRSVFPVTLRDPVAPEAPPRQYEVVARSDADGSPAGYRMTVQVNVCTDGLCRMVNVTLYWDALGYYERLKCPPETPLTRKEHDPFTPDDYRKLDRILENRESILGRLAYTALVEQQPEQAEEGEQVDGWSGATPQTVADSVVEGAAFTTWTLWHWVNGEIVSHLRDSTVERATPQFVRRLLRSEHQREVGFALRNLLNSERPDERLVDDVLHAMENTRHAVYVSLALDYLVAAIDDERRLHDRLIGSFRRLDDHTSRPILDYFSGRAELPPKTLEGLSGVLEHLPYFQVHRILLLLEEREGSAEVEANVARLLGHENFFIARRAYEHLRKQDLGDGTARQLAAFRERYADRL